MPGMNGLELQTALREKRVVLPVIIITAHGDVPTVRASLKAGAVDFLEKTVDPDALLIAVRAALDTDAARRRQARGAELAEQQLSTLTARERQVLELVAKGNHNREIASALGISPRTVEVHRARVMEKLHAQSVSELVHIVLNASQPTNDGLPAARE